MTTEYSANPIAWILAPYDSPPGDLWRPLRSDNLSRALIRRGYRVVLWLSCFSHQTKTFRASPWEERNESDLWSVVFVPVPKYRKNIDFRRLVAEAVFARNAFIKGRATKSRPSVIITREPPQICGYFATRLGKLFGCPIISDVHDLWPEFYHQIFPRHLRPAGRAILAPFYFLRKYNLQRSDAICALAKPYLEKALESIPAAQKHPHGLFYNGIDVPEFRKLIDGHRNQLAPTAKKGVVRAVYAGSLGNSYDVQSIIKAGAILRRSAVPCSITVAGTGPLWPEIEAAATRGDLNYVGQLGPSSLARLYSESEIGICAYLPRSNVEMPDKFYDYTAAGFAIVNSLRGEVSEIIAKKELGINIEAGNAVSLANALINLTEDSSARQRMAQNSAAIAMDYDATLQFDRYASFVDMVRCKA